MFTGIEDDMSDLTDLLEAESSMADASSPAKMMCKEEPGPSPTKSLEQSPGPSPLKAGFSLVGALAAAAAAAAANSSSASRASREKKLMEETLADASDGAAPGVNSKKGRKPFACNVCGIQYQDMPSCGKQCHVHKNDVAALGSQLKKKAISTDSTPEDVDNSKKFEEWKKTAGPPPTEFSKEVLLFSASCPTKGQGIGRDPYCSFRKQEKHTSKTESKKGVHCSMMHHIFPLVPLPDLNLVG